MPAKEYPIRHPVVLRMQVDRLLAERKLAEKRADEYSAHLKRRCRAIIEANQIKRAQEDERHEALKESLERVMDAREKLSGRKRKARAGEAEGAE